MKRLPLLLVCFAIVGTLSFANGSKEATSAKGGKVIGYYKDAADVFYKDGFDVFKALATKAGWQVLDVVGQGTAPEQIAAVQNFITQKVDAVVVVQNSPEASAQTEKMCHDAGIPEFNLTHNPPNNPGLAGFSGYDWVLDGELAGQNAMKHGVKRVIVIEGKLGQGTAAGQTQGFLEAYQKAGKDIGNLLQSVGTRGAGGADLKVVYWASGNWFADPAKKAMQNAITALGPNGWDGAYVENDDMMKGAISAIQDAGLDPSKYWLGSSNGREDSWDWVAKGLETFDVSESPTLEADIAFQQMSAYFAGKPYKKAIFVHMIPFDKENMDVNKLIPWITADYLAKRAAGAFIFDMNDPLFKANPAYQ